MSALLGDAVSLAEQQLELLRVGDFDGFLAGEPAYEAACTAVLTSIQGADSEMQRLVVAVGGIAAELARLRDETGVAIGRFRATRAAAGAYLPGADSGYLDTRLA
jgi:hypothetical protein